MERVPTVKRAIVLNKQLKFLRAAYKNATDPKEKSFLKVEFLSRKHELDKIRNSFTIKYSH